MHKRHPEGYIHRNPETDRREDPSNKVITVDPCRVAETSLTGWVKDVLSPRDCGCGAHRANSERAFARAGLYARIENGMAILVRGL